MMYYNGLDEPKPGSSRTVSTQPGRVPMIGPVRRGIKGFLGVTLWLALTPTLAALPRPVLDELRKVGIPASSVAVVVQEAGARRPTLAQNTGEALNPASVMKLVTTYAALELDRKSVV